MTESVAKPLAHLIPLPVCVTAAVDEMTPLRRSLLPLALALLIALAAVACVADAAHDQSESAVAEAFEPATHPPTWDKGHSTAHILRARTGQAGRER